MAHRSDDSNSMNSHYTRHHTSKNNNRRWLLLFETRTNRPTDNCRGFEGSWYKIHRQRPYPRERLSIRWARAWFEFLIGNDRLEDRNQAGCLFAEQPSSMSKCLNRMKRPSRSNIYETFFAFSTASSR